MMKTPLLNWKGKKVLWLGTSIPQMGIGVDSYPELFGDKMGCTVTNMAWAGSHATWDIDATNDGCVTNRNAVKGLSASRAELQTKRNNALPGSAYLPGCDPITILLDQSYEHRITTGNDVVFLDHNHNDRVIDPALRDAIAGDINCMDKATIYGAWNFLITQIKARNPNAEIILMTAPTVWKNGVDNGSFQHIHGCIYNIAKKWGLSVYDLCQDLALGKDDTMTFLGDGTHPTTYDQRNCIANHLAKWANGF